MSDYVLVDAGRTVMEQPDKEAACRSCIAALKMGVKGDPKVIVDGVVHVVRVHGNRFKLSKAAC